MIGGDNPNVKYLPARYGETKNTLANVSKAYDLLGWSAKVALKDIINNY